MGLISHMLCQMFGESTKTKLGMLDTNSAAPYTNTLV